jgi:DNA-binding MarR family transcriptional regulator
VAVQRLADAGYVERTTDPHDRRRAAVTMTEIARRRTGEVFGPVGAEGARQLSRYSPEELALLHDFLLRARQLQDKHTRRLTATPDGD